MRWVLVAIAAPWAVTIGWAWVGLMFTVGAARDVRYHEFGRLHATWRPWVRRVGWRWSTTVGFAVIFQLDHLGTDIAAHEQIHTEQIEDLMMLSLILGVIVGLVSWDPWLGGALYLAGGLYQLPNFLTAVLRGGNAYRDALHERHAYAEEDEITDPR